ncbi:sigma-54 dependent transcriptional regulator [Massilia sp. CF038]|uniref:sigma-54 dependent transcriptional regulator n=1 Tax=Massilia sp. CF038 TaxID=1881045 RepID=UPI000921CF50|nr:sigma-54 dependent transcriptional regulator [Massilia sp. CF038]SHH18785.1 DNA-binding transcriptional response regulator, NtrC family, contains REC, AAA-type ATPase, and a Fis-type DNA-binding domains [Massilia sp. CF038]
MRELVCISHDDTWAARLPTWDVQLVSGLAEAARLLRATPCLTGLIDLPASEGEAGLRALDRFLRLHWRTHWIALAPPSVACMPDWADIVLDHLFDFHTTPADPLRLAHALGHAHGVALLRSQSLAGTAPPMGLAGNSAAITRLRAQIRKVARAEAPVLIWGESGSGKELAAQAIHAASMRARGPFVPINCGAIPPALIQSELFGHARGAFTGAARDKAGLIESAAGGSIFLDEIADLPKELQSNLLRFLQEKTIYRVGATRSITVDVRVIAASHVDLQQAVALGQFREDLYYRLNVLPLTVPALRERRDDLAILAEQFFRAYAAEKSPRLKGFSSAALRALRAHAWPGNVRELINRVRRALVLAEGRLIAPQDLGLAPAHAAAHDGAALGVSRIEAERAAILASLQRWDGNVTRAARELAISRMTLYRQMAKHGIAT